MAPTTAVDFDQLNDAGPGKVLIVRFTPRATEYLPRLCEMCKLGVLDLNPVDLALLMGFHRHHYWDNDSDRTQSLVVGLRWDRKIFEDRMGRALEHLEVLSSPLGSPSVGREDIGFLGPIV